MSDERYVKVTRDQCDGIVGWTSDGEEIAAAFDAAEGQRVESIRWCCTHGRQEGFCNPTALELAHGFPMAANCVIVEALLILPPEAAS